MPRWATFVDLASLSAEQPMCALGVHERAERVSVNVSHQMRRITVRGCSGGGRTFGAIFEMSAIGVLVMRV